MKLLAYGLAVAMALIPMAALAQDEAPRPAPDAAWLAKQRAAFDKLKPTDGWQPLPGGVQWRRVAGDGRGTHPRADDQILVHYAGSLTDGTEFDSSFKREWPIVIGVSEVIEGWQEAMPMAGVGDTIEIVIPAALGYGDEGQGPIPRGATLLFKVQLLGIAPRQSAP